MKAPITMHCVCFCGYTFVRYVSLTSLPQGPGLSGEVLIGGGSGSCNAVSRAHDNPLPSSPSSRAQLTGISPYPYREVRRGRGHRTGWLSPAPTGFPATTLVAPSSLILPPRTLITGPW